MRSTIFVALVFIGSACGGAQVDIRNQSSARLHDVTVVARDASAVVNFVEPKSEQRTSICPKGEAGAIQVSFVANGQIYRGAQALYFECNSSYAIKVDVSPSFEISASVGLK